MTIKRKLTLNIAIVLGTICCVAAAGVTGMSQVRSRLFDLTERSTPFQLRTTESQRATQLAIGELDRLGRARTRHEYRQAGQAARQALQEADSAAQALAALTGGAGDEGSAELGGLAREILQVTDSRLAADSAAGVASRQIAAQFAELDRQMGALDAGVRQLQKTQQATFGAASAGVERSTRQLRAVDQLKGQLLELQVAVLDLQAVQAKSAVTIARARINSQINKINQNEVLGSDRSIAAGTAAYLDEVGALVQAKQAAAETAGAEAGTQQAEINTRLKETFAVLQLAIAEAGQTASQRSGQEQERQTAVVGQSTLASSVLLQASELVALGLTIQAEATRLISARRAGEVDSLETRLAAAFTRGQATSRALGGLLGKLDARPERRLLESARGLLESSRERLFAAEGVIALIRRQLSMGEQAAQASERLRQLVARQAAQGRETLSSARGEQEKAIGTVNRMVRLSLILILSISAGALLFGVLFGTWVYRSIARTLGQVEATIGEVERSSDLSIRVPVEGADEVGRMATAFNALLENQQQALGAVNRVMAALAEGEFGQRVTTELRGDLARLTAAVNASAGRIQLLLGDAVEVVGALAHGDLSRRVTVEGRGELALLKDHLNASLEALGQTLTRLHANAGHVALASRETSTAVGQISSDVQVQTRHIGEVSAAVRRAADSAGHIAQHTTDASATSRRAVERVHAGKERMARLVEVVQHMAENSVQISGISEAIGKIAAQTRLLALNATIEAARAGEAGLGFAVVADEVGILAGTSSTSSGEIARLVQEAAAEAGQAVEAVHEVSRMLDEIQAGSEEADAMLGRVSQALADQRQAIDGIEHSVLSLSSIAENNAGSAEEIAVTMAELATLAEATRTEVEQFRLA
ncbi:MAG: methyl-accepting chemotaxis protein [Candidatus Delongbacteria bacterium]